MESARKELRNPENTGKNFSRLESMMELHYVREPTRIFSKQESGFSICDMNCGRAEGLVKQGTRGKTKEPKFRGSWDHVTFMTGFSVAGQIMTLILVLPGIEAMYCKRENGKYETPAEYLPNPNYLHMKKLQV